MYDDTAGTPDITPEHVVTEQWIDTDGNGTLDQHLIDYDGDGQADIQYDDFGADGLAHHALVDANGDGVADAEFAGIDSAGIAHDVALDTDGDGYADVAFSDHAGLAAAALDPSSQADPAYVTDGTHGPFPADPATVSDSTEVTDPTAGGTDLTSDSSGVDTAWTSTDAADGTGLVGADHTAVPGPFDDALNTGMSPDTAALASSIDAQMHDATVQYQAAMDPSSVSAGDLADSTAHIDATAQATGALEGQVVAGQIDNEVTQEEQAQQWSDEAHETATTDWIASENAISEADQAVWDSEQAHESGE